MYPCGTRAAEFEQAKIQLAAHESQLRSQAAKILELEVAARTDAEARTTATCAEEEAPSVLLGKLSAETERREYFENELEKVSRILDDVKDESRDLKRDRDRLASTVIDFDLFKDGVGVGQRYTFFSCKGASRGEE